MGFSLTFGTVLSEAKRGSPSRSYELKFELTVFVMRVAAESCSGLTERSEKPGSDPIFGDGISPA